MASIPKTFGFGSSAPAEYIPASDTTNTTTVDFVHQAKLCLIGQGPTQVGALYESTVTKAKNTAVRILNFMRFHFGKLSSTSAYGRAKACDIATQKIAKGFNEAITELVEATFFNNLPSKQASAAGIHATTFTANNVATHSFEENSALNSKNRYESALKELHSKLTESLFANDPNATTKTQLFFLMGAIQALTDEQNNSYWVRRGDEISKDTRKTSKGVLASRPLNQIQLPNQKLHIAITQFVNLFYTNRVDLFANQDIENITPESIVAEVRSLKQLFPGRNSEKKILQDLCRAIMTNPRVADAANALISPDSIEAETAMRRSAFVTESNQLKARLASLCRPQDAANNPIFQGQRLEYGGLLHKAWINWRGYEEVGRGSTTPGKVIININNNEVEVDGQVGTNRWGNDIGDKVWVFGKEQKALAELHRFLEALNDGVADRDSLNTSSVASLSRILTFDPSAAAPRLNAARAQATNAVKENDAAEQQYKALEQERLAILDRLHELSDSDDEYEIRMEVTSAHDKRSNFLRIFLPDYGYGLKDVVHRLTPLLDDRPELA